MQVSECFCASANLKSQSQLAFPRVDQDISGHIEKLSRVELLAGNLGVISYADINLVGGPEQSRTLFVLSSDNGRLWQSGFGVSLIDAHPTLLICLSKSVELFSVWHQI
jgi:hypothetical protein